MTPHGRVIIAATSFTLLAAELVWTRIFSAEFFYTFAFLVLSTAILGMGLGALALRLVSSLRRDSALGVSLSLTGAAALAGPPLAFRLGVDFQLMFGSWTMMARVAAMIVLLGSAFFFGGFAVAWLLRRHTADVPRLYAADLLGAGAGVVGAIWAMNAFGTPKVVFLTPIPVLVAALVASRRALKALPIFLLAAAAALSPRAADLLRVERTERAPVIYEHWDAMAKIKMYDFGGQYRGLNVDNVANTPVIPFDGDWEKWHEDPANSEWDINVGYLVGLFDACTFLSLGSGAGMDVLQALDHGAASIHAVEVNGHINRMMVDGDPSGYFQPDPPEANSTSADVTADDPVYDPADDPTHDAKTRIVTLPEYSGHIYADDRVTVVTEDARTYVRRHPNTFDVIYSVSSNTWAALGSGAFALSENYLFTTEAFMDYWRALTDEGFLSMEHQVYMPRLVSEVVEALQRLGVEQPTEHMAVYNLPRLRRNLLLLSKRPLTDDLRYRAFGELTAEHQQHIHPLFPAPDSLQSNLINQIALKGWRAMSDSAAVNLSPCTDDRPFIAQMGRWRDLRDQDFGSVSPYAEFRGFPTSKLILVIILGIVGVLVLPLNLLPYLRRGARLRSVPWLYFSLIGMAFMSVEVILIQKYTLFIGASVYSIGTVLFVLLVASGIGSQLSTRIDTRVAFLGIVAWLLLDVIVFGALTSSLASLSMASRVVITGVLIAPLGLLMGVPFPKGAFRVGELVDWAFAVNGAASVLGATLIVLIAFDFGFTVALAIGAMLYLAAGGLYSRRASWSPMVERRG